MGESQSLLKLLDMGCVKELGGMPLQGDVKTTLVTGAEGGARHTARG